MLYTQISANFEWVDGTILDTAAFENYRAGVDLSENQCAFMYTHQSAVQSVSVGISQLYLGSIA